MEETKWVVHLMYNKRYFFIFDKWFSCKRDSDTSEGLCTDFIRFVNTSTKVFCRGFQGLINNWPR